MKRRTLRVICLVLITALLCCGCAGREEQTPTTVPTEPPVLTPAETAAKMQEALLQTPCSEMTMTMDLKMSIAAEGIEAIEMDMHMSTEMTVSQDPVSTSSLVTVQMGQGEESTQTQTQSYTVMEDGVLVTYMHSDGVWMKTATGQTPEDFAKAASAVTIDPNHVAIDETVTKWNGKEAICLKTEMTGESVQSAVDGVLGNMGNVLGESAELLTAADYTQLSCSAAIYLAPETFLPMAEEMTFTGLEEVVAPVFQELDISLKVPVYTATVEFLSYEPKPAVTLPEGAAEKAQAWSRLLANEPDNGDGTFTIREGAALIDIVHPDGFTVEEKDYDHVTFQREDYRKITYMMYYTTGADTTGANFLAENDKSEERWTNLGGGSVEREQGTLTTDSFAFTCDLLATTWETGRTDANFYAWTVLGTDDAGTYYLYVEVTDGYNDGMGFSKSADITADEFTAYLNAAVPSKLTVE